jgi:hypothetical protein
MQRNRINNVKIAWSFLIISTIIISSSITYADLYLNSRTGNINLNTTGETRLKITPGGNLNLIGLVNVSIPGNLSVGGNVSVDSSTLFVDSESNRVGIGTTGPDSALHILGANTLPDSSGTSTPDSSLRLGNSATNVILDVGIDNTIGLSWLQSRNQANYVTNYHLILNPNGGKVGIGTTIPNAQLEVNATANGIGILTNGSIGIGTANPSSKLHLADSNSVRILAQGETNRGIYLDSGNDTSGVSTVSTDSTARELGFAIDSVEKVRIDSSGNVGIGTIAPGVTLDVNGSIRTTPGSGGTITAFESDSTRANRLIIGADATGSFIHPTWGSGGTSDLRFLTDSGTERIRITTTGNVGIGTTSPGAELHVNGSAGTNLYLEGGGNNGAVIRFRENGTERSTIRTDAEIGGIRFETGGTTSGAGPQAAILIDKNGKVGIGTTSPAGKLHIVGIGSSDPGDIHIQDTSPNIFFNETDSEMNMSIDVDGGQMRFSSLTGSMTATARIVINGSNGNVGIGTTSPGSALDVGSGTITLDSGEMLSPSGGYVIADGDAGFIARQSGSNIIVINSNTLRGDENNVQLLGSSQIKWKELWITGLTATGGSVGIGTSNPQDLLHINDTESGIHSTLTIEHQDDQTPRIRFRTNGVNRLDLASDSVSHLRLFNGSGSEFFTIDNSGDVGIGTPNPSAWFNPSPILHINGTRPTIVMTPDSDSGLATIQFKNSTSGGTTVEEMHLNYAASQDDPYLSLHAYKAGGVVFRILGNGNIKMPYLASNGGEDRYACVDSATGNLTDKGSACSTSSIRFKENVRDSDYGLKEVMQLRQVRYNYKKEKDPDKDANNTALKKDHIGLIAEEVLQVLPELIYYDQDGNVDNIRYEAMHSVLAKAIQELSEQNQEQQMQIELLKNKIETLK